MESVHMIINGRVQGVGFRFSAQQKAKEFGIKGWVRNRKNGSVEIEAEGKERNLQSFIEAIKHGPSPYAKINKVNIDSSDKTKGFNSFQIEH